MTATAAPSLRWSSVRDCARKAILEATGDPDRDWTREEKGWLWRGRRIGQDYVLFNAFEHGWTIHVASGPNDWVPAGLLAADPAAAGLVAEVPIPWELGVGHADLFVRETSTLVEVLSSASAGSMLDGKLLQLVGYLAHYPAAEKGALVVVDPSSMIETDRIIVKRDSKRYTELAAEVADRIARVKTGLTGDLPARVCKKPSHARGHFCRHAVTCFDGWEPEEAQPIANPEIRELAVSLYEAKQKLAAVNQTVKTLDAEKKAIQADLDELLEPGEYEIGPLKVRRRGKSRTNFNLKAAEATLAAGVLDDFVSVSRWTEYDITRESDAPLRDAESFGDHPFDEPLEGAA